MAGEGFVLPIVTNRNNKVFNQKKSVVETLQIWTLGRPDFCSRCVTFTQNTTISLWGTLLCHKMKITPHKFRVIAVTFSSGCTINFYRKFDNFKLATDTITLQNYFLVGLRFCSIGISKTQFQLNVSGNIIPLR